MEFSRKDSGQFSRTGRNVEVYHEQFIQPVSYRFALLSMDALL